MEPDLITFQTEDDDLFFNGTDFVLLTNREALADKLRQALRLRKDSCVYDLEAGFAWDRLHDSTNPVLYNTLVRNFLNSFNFVSKITRLDILFDTPSRNATIDFEIETTLGEPVAVTFDTVV